MGDNILCSQLFENVYVAKIRCHTLQASSNSPAMALGRNIHTRKSSNDGAEAELQIKELMAKSFLASSPITQKAVTRAEF